MRSIVKKILIIFNFSLFVCLFFNPIFANYHSESSNYGFEVKNNNYEQIKWSKHIKRVSVYQNGKVKGTISLFVGTANSKEKLSDGNDAVTIMIKAIVTPQKYEYSRRVLWWNETVTEYGVIDELTISVDFYYNQLIDVQPKNNPKGNNYTVGINSKGISASQSFTQGSLTITNLSNTPKNFASTRFKYNVSMFGWDWERNSYNFYESEQKMTYTISRNIVRGYYIDVHAKFDSVDSRPHWFQDTLNKKSYGYGYVWFSA